MTKPNRTRRVAALLGLVLLITTMVGCADSTTSGNGYVADPVKDGVKYDVTGAPENDKSADNPRNQIQCFRVKRSWTYGMGSTDEVELGTYCKVDESTTTTTEAK